MKVAAYPIRREVGSFVMTKQEAGGKWDITLLNGVIVLGQAKSSSDAYRMMERYATEMNGRDD